MHETIRIGQAGRIEIWPVEFKDEKDETEPWTAPVDREPANHPRRKLARRIADTIKSWLDDKRLLVSRGRPVRPGDILVLVRRRNSFADALIRELRQRGIPVAGADRLKLAEHIAVEDLIAAARFVLQPEDDFTLACVLKGPLLQRDDGAPIDDGDLFALAHGRGKDTLLSRLEAAASNGEPYGSALKRLAGWRSKGMDLPPFEFFSRLLNQGRKRLLSRLGPEAADPTGALLDLALDYERQGAPTLAGFLAWFAQGEAEIKRDMEQGADEVRVMTVHGAKGLEANVVFLPDTCDIVDGKTQSALVMSDGDIPFWRFSDMVEPEAVGRWRERQLERAREEYRRLLYVGMTRARDELYVCGYSTGDKLKAECWYELMHGALQPHAREVLGIDKIVAAWRIDGRQTQPPADRPEKATGEIFAAAPPEWATAMAPREADPIRWLSPSRLTEERLPAPSPLDSGGQDRFARGRAVHALLQLLPNLPSNERRQAALRFLARRKLDGAIADEVIAVIEHPAHAEYFAAGSLAEVPIAALLGEGREAIAGRIDRMAVSEDCVHLVDFKSGRRPSQTSAANMSQLAAYRAAVMQLFPGRTIKTALLWTEEPCLQEVEAG